MSIKRPPKKLFLFVIAGLAVAGLLGKKVWESSHFVYTGTLEATEIDLPSQLATTVKQNLVEEGDAVEKNQPLVLLNGREVHIEKNLANSTLDRAKKLRASDSISQETYEQIKNRSDAVRLRQDYCTIVSPIHGVVLTRYHEPGEWVTPGSKLVTVADLDTIWTMIYVPQAKIASLKLGMTVQGTLPELPGKTFQGTVVKINQEAEFTPKNVLTENERTHLVFGVKISFKGQNPAHVLKPGMIIDIQLPK